MGINISESMAALGDACAGDRLYVKKGPNNERSIAVAKNLWDKISNYYINYSWVGSGRKGDVADIKEMILLLDLGALKNETNVEAVTERVDRVFKLVMHGAVPEKSQDEFDQKLSSLVTALVNKKDGKVVLDQLILRGLVTQEMCKEKLIDTEANEGKLREKRDAIEQEIKSGRGDIDILTRNIEAKTKDLNDIRYGEKGARLNEMLQTFMNPPRTAIPEEKDPLKQKEQRERRDALSKLCQTLYLGADTRTPIEQEKLEKDIIEAMQAIKGESGLFHFGSRSHSQVVYKKALQELPIITKKETEAQLEMLAEAQAQVLSTSIQMELQSNQMGLNSKKYEIDPRLGEKLDAKSKELFKAPIAERPKIEKEIILIMQEMKGGKTSQIRLFSFQNSEKIYKTLYEQANAMAHSQSAQTQAQERGRELSEEIQKRMNSGYLPTTEESVELTQACQDYFFCAAYKTEAEMNTKRQEIINLLQRIKGEVGNSTKYSEEDLRDACILLEREKYEPSQSYLNDLQQLKNLERKRKLLEQAINTQQGTLANYEDAVQSLPALKAQFAGESLFLGIKAKLWYDGSDGSDNENDKKLLELCIEYCGSSSPGENVGMPDARSQQKLKIINHLRICSLTSTYEGERNPDLFWEGIDFCFNDADRLYMPPATKIVENHYADPMPETATLYDAQAAVVEDYYAAPK